MSRTHLWIEPEPRGAAYAALLDFCAARCVRASVVIQEGALPSKAAFEFLDRCGDLISERRRQSEWPGGGTLLGLAEVAYFPVSPMFIDRLKEVAGGLYEWVHPLLPEDLAFYRADGEALLGTIAHEKWSFVVIDDEERQAFLTSVPGLRLSEEAPPMID